MTAGKEARSKKQAFAEAASSIELKVNAEGEEVAQATESNVDVDGEETEQTSELNLNAGGEEAAKSAGLEVNVDGEETAPSIELKVNAEGVEEPQSAGSSVNAEVEETEALSEAENLLTTNSSASLAQSIAEPIQPSAGAKPYPGMAVGLITSLLWLVFLFCVPASYREYSKAIDANLFSSPYITLALAFLSANCFWFCTAYRNLSVGTAKYFSDANNGQTEKSLLLALVPLSIAVMFFVWLQMKLLFCAFPLVAVSALCAFLAMIYWFLLILRFPLMLGGRFNELAAEKNLYSGKPALFRDFLARRQFGFPNFVSAFLMLPLGGFTFILYWREALKGLDKLQAFQPEAVSSRNTKTKAEDGRLVIRYRKFATIERFLHQRLAANKKLDKWKWWIIGANALFFSIVGTLLFAYQDGFAQWFTGTAGNLLTGGAQGGLGLNSFVLSNGMLLFLNALVLFSSGFAAYLYCRRQPTHYAFTALGFQSFRYRGDLRLDEPVVLWSEVESIRLVAARGKDVGTQTLNFNLKNGSTVKLKLESIDSIEDKETVLKAIEKWAPGVHRDAAVIQALQPPVDHSYTELWLQALAAPPQRDRLKPLERDIVLSDGRYRVRRALGVGGQGAAYEAQDRNTGEVVVLKEFLLPIYVDVNVRKEVLERFEGEARILKQLDNNQVVKLLDYFVEDHRAYLVLEHIDGLSLRETVVKEGPLSEERVRDLSRQMCKILSYLHSQEPAVVHRDFTPENLILRNDGLLKLIDFNVAKQVESTATGSVVGKPAYLPPEQFRGQPVCQSDIYGMGATLSFLLTGEEPEPISVSHPRKINSQVTSSLDGIVAKATAIELKNRYQSAGALLSDLEVAYENDGVISEAFASTGEPEGVAETNHGELVRGTAVQDATIHSSASQSQNNDSQIKQGETSGASTAETAVQDRAMAASAKAAGVPVQHNLKFKERDKDAQNVNLKVGGEAPAGGMLVADQQTPDAKLYGEATRGESEELSGEAIKAGSEKLWHRLPPALRRVLVPVKFLGWLTSWFTVVLAFCFAVNSDSISWFDSQADLHKHAHIAAISYLDGKYGDTVKESKICQKIAPDQPEGYAGEGLGLMDRSYVIPDDKIIYEKFARAAALEPDNKAYQFLLGLSAGKVGKYDQARQALALSMKLKKLPFHWEPIATLTTVNDQLNAQARMQIARDYLSEGNARLALATFGKKVKSQYVPSGEILGIRVAGFELLHEPVAALNCLKKQSQTYWEPDSFWRTYGSTRDALKGIEQAYQADKVSLDARNAFLEGFAYADQLLYEKALEKFNAAVGFSPQYAPTYLWRAAVLRQLHRYDQALQDVDLVLKAEPSFSAQFLRARILQNSGKWQEAFDQYSKAITPDIYQSSDKLVYQGQCLAALGKYDQALALYDRVNQMHNGNWSRPLILKVRALCADKQYKLASKTLEDMEAQHFSVDPYERALIYQASGDQEKAKYYFAEAARRSPSQTPLPRLWINGEPRKGPIGDFD